MGGLCLGSAALPGWFPRATIPCGCTRLSNWESRRSAILALFGVPLVGRVYVAGATSGTLDWSYAAVVAAVCLLPPTVLMGASLPAISRWVETTPKGISWLGLLYSANVAGAVSAACSPDSTCCASTIWRRDVRRCGNQRGGRLAALAMAAAHPARADTTGNGRIKANLRVRRARRQAGLRRDRSFRPDSARRGSRLDAATLAAAGRDGLHVLHHSCGVPVGLMGRQQRRFVSVAARARTAIGAGCLPDSCWLAPSPGPPSRLAYVLPYWPVDPWLSLSPWFNFDLDLTRCLRAILPATLLWGASFPLALASAAADGEDPARLSGEVYAANTAGSIVGALVFSLVLIPTIGTRGSQQVLIWLAAVSAARGSGLSPGT